MKLSGKSAAIRVVAAKVTVFVVGTSMVLGVHAMDMSAHEHHHDHMSMSPAPGVVPRSVVDIELPSVKLVRQDGKAVDFRKEISSGRPTILAFMYTSCTTVCPVTSQIMEKTQELLGSDLSRASLVSVSIDPEYDTPARLRDYSQKFHAKPQWQHYTGTQSASVAVQKAFGAYRGDKMNHVPLIFITRGGGKSWVRLEGFPSAEQVTKEYRGLLAH